jgi:hypothetical protein
MFTLILEGALLVMLIGLGAKYYLDKTEHEMRIDKQELTIATIALLLVIVPLVSWIGTKVSITNQVTFNESWGGWEVSAEWQRIRTYRDGPMRHSYKGDPYQVWIDTSYTDSEGKRHSEGHYETRYHDIPYTSEEWTFVIHTTLGDYVIADRNLPDPPNAYRFRSYKAVPDGIGQIGVPDFWRAADNRLKAGNPGPVTARMEYKNYILASQSSILRRASGDIDQYTKDGLLPKINSSVHGYYFQDRAYFVGTHPAGDWQGAINRFDAALGSSLQGDLHLVIVDANKVTNPNNYQLALMAYWQSGVFEKDALSKNGIVVIVGSEDGRTVKWARAATGMPAGNEEMVLDIQNNLKGVALTPEAILGSPRVAKPGSSQIVHTNGALENTLWGPHAFVRVRMDGHGKNGVGYAYLLRELEPTGWQRFWILFVTGLLSIVVWGVCIAHGVPAYRNRSFRRY